jgi:hypothetical protein
LGGALTNVAGNLTFVSAGGRVIYFNRSAGGYNLSVGGNFDNQGVALILAFTLSSPSTITIGGNFTMSKAGTVNPVLTFGQTNTSDVTVNIAGNFLTTGGSGNGTIAKGSTTFNANFNFNGSGVQTFSNGVTPISTAINYTIASGSTLDLGNAGVLAGTGTFTNNGILRVGSTNAAGALASNITVSGTKTYASGSTVTYNGATAQFIGSGHPSTSGVNTVINNSSGVTLASAVTIGGSLTLTSGNLLLAANTLTLSGTYTPNANSIGITSSSGLVINGTGAFGTLSFTGGPAIGNFTINRTSSGSVTLGNDLNVTGSFTQTAGDIIVNGKTFQISGAANYSRTAGNLNVNSSSTVIFTGTGTLPSAVGFTGGTLGTLTLDKDNASLVLNTSSSLIITNLNLTGGIFTSTGSTTMASGGTITRTDDGSITNAPSATSSYNIIYNFSNPATTGPELLSSSTAINNLTNNGSSTVTLGSAVTINGILTLTNGVFNAGSNAVTMKGNFVSNATATFTSNTVTMGGTTTVSGTTAPTFNNLTVSGTFTPNTNYQVNGNIVNNGTYNAGSAALVTFGGTTAITGSGICAFNSILVSNSMTAPGIGGTFMVAGDFTNNGTFAHNNGAVIFNGTTSILGSAATSLFKTTISGTLTAPSGTLSIAGDLANTGTFTSSGGTLVLNGTTGAQSITGTYSVNNMSVSNPSGVNNNGTIALNGTFSLLSAGIFDADGSGSGVFTIKSTNINAGGRIATLATPGNFGGKVTIERFVNGPDSYRYISFPLTSGNVGQWKSSFPVTGNFTDASPAGVNGVIKSSAASIFTYNPTTAAYVAVGSGASTASTALSNFSGYSVYTYLPTDFTISVTGNARTGNASIPVSTGYNLVANPYPSAIDWDNVTRTGFSSTMSIRVSNGVFASYVAGGASTNPPFVGWTGEVSTGQSFWVQATGATTLALTETAKTAGQYQFLREGAPSNLIRIALSSDKQRDETVIWFNQDATDGIDDLYDAIKMRNGYFDPGTKKGGYLNVSSYVGDSTDLAINGVAPLSSCNGVFKLNVSDVTPGSYSFSFSDLETMSLGYRFILVDRFALTEKEVSNGFQYSFDVTTDKASFGKDRFELRALLPNSLYVNSVVPPATSILDQCDAVKVPVSIATQSGVSYQFFLGTKVLSGVITGTNDKITVNIPKDSLKVGANAISLRILANSCEQFDYANALSYTYSPLAPVTVSMQGIKLKSSSTTGNQWYRDGQEIAGATSDSYYASGSGDYYVAVSNGVCSVQSDSLHFDIDLSRISAFPVPTSDKVYLVLPDKVSQSMSGYVLYDAKGVKILDQSSYPDLLVSEDKVLDLSSMESGMYLLVINSDTRYPVKIIKK